MLTTAIHKVIKEYAVFFRVIKTARVQMLERLEALKQIGWFDYPDIVKDRQNLEETILALETDLVTLVRSLIRNTHEYKANPSLFELAMGKPGFIQKVLEVL
jgi:hypothetical protein